MNLRFVLKISLAILFVALGGGVVSALLHRLRGRRRAAILMFHGVGEPREPPGDNIAPERFEQLMAYLARSWSVVPLGCLVDGLAGHSPLPDKPVAVTFDDGYVGVAVHAAPVLRRLSISGTVFISSAGFESDPTSEGERRTLSLRQALALDAQGVITVESHGKWHRRYSSVSETDTRTDILESRDDLRRMLGREVTLFAYPYGQWTEVRGPALAAVRAAGFKGAVTTVWGRYQDPSDLLTIRRVRVESHDTPFTLGLKLAGGLDWLEVWHGLKAVRLRRKGSAVR